MELSDGVCPETLQGQHGLVLHFFLPVSRASLFPRQVSHGLHEPKMTEAGLLYEMPVFLLNLLQVLLPGFTNFQMLLDASQSALTLFALCTKENSSMVICFPFCCGHPSTADDAW